MTTDTPLDRFIPLPALCERLGIKKTTVYELIKKGEIKPLKIGRKTVFSEHSIKVWMQARKIAAGLPAVVEAVI